MDRDREVNSAAAATVKLGQADEGEGAEGNKEDRCILSELSLELKATASESTPPTSSGPPISN